MFNNSIRNGGCCTIDILGKAKDLRSNTTVIYAKTSIDDYLDLVGDNFDDFEIQRKREKHQAYKRMKEDIINGALLPTITLAIKPEYVKKIVDILRKEGLTDDLNAELCKNGQVNILDGLQRTYILKDIKKEGYEFKDGQTLLLEFWLEQELKHLIYRIIVLNAGQKPMSLRHQVELLFSTIKEKLESEISDLEIYVEKSGNRRNKPGKFAFVRLVSAYQCYLTKSHEISKENIIAQQLAENTVFDSDENTLEKQFISFSEYLKTYVALDLEFYRIYNRNGSEHNNSNWLADENVLCGFFSALSDFGTSEVRIERITNSLKKLRECLSMATEESDPFGLTEYDKVRTGLNPRKQNVGYSTRALIMNGFKEYFREEGEKELKDCWVAGA